MLTHFYKEQRTLIDFRRGPLGPHFDGFAAELKSKGYSRHTAITILGKSCQFNAFLVDRGVTRCSELSESHIEAFTEDYRSRIAATGSQYPGAKYGYAILKQHLLPYLIRIGAIKPPKERKVVTPYNWVLDPFVKHLEENHGLSQKTLANYVAELTPFLQRLGSKVRRDRLRKLNAVAIEKALLDHFKDSKTHPSSLGTILRRFFSFCEKKRLLKADFSGLVPSVRRYGDTALPKGMPDSDLERLLGSIPTDTAKGLRNYAIIILIMAYGIRAVSVAELLLEDIDWAHSRIKIRAKKGGKEVVLPLLEPVGEALVNYLRTRRADTPYREVFLSSKAPYQPLSGLAISATVNTHMRKAGVKVKGSGSSTLRHSWAIRALAGNSAIKTIADVLGHRYINTTFIYAKADLKSLREVALPWPEKE